jgi:hypothetical protein
MYIYRKLCSTYLVEGNSIYKGLKRNGLLIVTSDILLEDYQESGLYLLFL